MWPIILFIALSCFGLWFLRRTYLRMQRRILALERRSHKITQTAHKFIVDRIIDLRRPLQGLVGVQDLYKLDGSLKNNMNEYFEIADHCSKYVIRELERVQLYTEIESGKLRFDPLEFSAKACLLNAIQSAQDHYKRDKSSVNVEWSPDLYEQTYGSELALKTILYELIENAFKYGGQGIVTIKAVPEATNKNLLRFIIRDSGPGLPDKITQFLRNRYLGKSKLIPWSDVKTGLGLTLIKKIIDVTGGELIIESDKSLGSVFSFVLSESTLKQIPTNDLAQPFQIKNITKALVVDDESITRQILVSLLAKLNISADIAENGRDAIQKQQFMSYDLILMDLNMPVLDGFEASRVILRELNQLHKPNIIALSSHCTQEQIDRALSVGISEFIAKPVGLDKIKLALTRLGHLGTAGNSDATNAVIVANANIDLRVGDKTKKVVIEPGYYINFNKLYSSLGENLVMCQDILKKARVDLQIDRAKLNAAIDTGDKKQLSNVLHKLYGEFAIIICEPGLQLIKRIEAAAREANKEALTQYRAEFEEFYDQLLREIDQLTTADNKSA